MLSDWNQAVFRSGAVKSGPARGARPIEFAGYEPCARQGGNARTVLDLTETVSA